MSFFSLQRKLWTKKNGKCMRKPKRKNLIWVKVTIVIVAFVNVFSAQNLHTHFTQHSFTLWVISINCRYYCLLVVAVVGYFLSFFLFFCIRCNVNEFSRYFRRLTAFMMICTFSFCLFCWWLCSFQSQFNKRMNSRNICFNGASFVHFANMESDQDDDWRTAKEVEKINLKVNKLQISWVCVWVCVKNNKAQ